MSESREMPGAESVLRAMTGVTLPRAVIEQVLRKAYSLGQTYWQQADSVSPKQWKKSDETRATFQALVADTLAAPQPEPDAWRIFDGEGGYDYKDEAPEPLDVEWAARYKRKYEPLYLHPPQPPPGYVLVPIEPTPEMLAAGVAAESNAATHVQERLTLYAYRAMIAAAQKTKP